MKTILVRNLSKNYTFYEKETGISGSLKGLLRPKKVSVQAVKGISLDAEEGELIGFIGPNGAGKTTTLKMLSGILYPSTGQVEVLGSVPSRRQKPFLKSISFVAGQRNRLFWDLPAQDYFSFLKVAYEIPDNVYRQNLKTLVEMAGIGDVLNVPQRKLSLGERKRSELVGALLHDPKVVFLDEPTNGLDLASARKMREFVKEKGKAGNSTVILTSHNVADIEQVCERIIIMNGGEIVFDDQLKGLTRLDGFKKEIRVVFSEPFTLDQIGDVGRIKERDGPELLIEVEPNHSATFVARLFANFSIKDISISSPPLEKVIESIYRARRKFPREISSHSGN